MSSIVKAPLAKSLKIALIQISAGSDKAANLTKVKKFIANAVKESKIGKLDLIMLPECFNSPYAVDQFANYAEVIPSGETTSFLSGLAKEHKVFLIGGSIPELDEAESKVYNTSLTFSPTGELIAKHRKAHLFDIDIPGGITFKESVSLTGGDKATVLKLGDFGNIGIGICYDIRFPELATIATRSPYNSFGMFYPGAFNTTTGPMHWHLLARSRSVDNQIFTVLCSPARDVEGGGYQAYGHSLVVDPAGNIISEAGEGEEIIYAELDPSLLPKVREAIPVHFQRRFDIYPDYVSDESIKVGDK
ncbi:Omega-amidase nit3 [Yamadazyma tenuis]|uniref:CN hydrolase domain-containing protein n=1 Tax=Candida tenuis (strain ATCC 10573 / BCRC 21748 / CBS 615 / JCM 9827 / NBRC 10315 / NRRL Y-1498 / VKM Y-70) TaxID=590646 RepID=G3B114_CANTC|nr:uncharacterized protein CANTEDRAFT_104031 [Yamadazyma tenuis ATCC 10573]EGV64857.1 hypothetical protein CANTEDRAFT_104031 [Yamadazyma tenuis ATCC 10573]WEJ97651.1 Omega-amidase nit3 [Yamadazyma tenuis]